MNILAVGLVFLTLSVDGFRDPVVALRAGSPNLDIEKVLDGRNLTAVVVGAKEVARNTIQVVLEANITSPTQRIKDEEPQLSVNKTVVRVVYSAQDPRSIKLIKDGLMPFFKRPEVINVTSLELVPFGQAVEVKVDDLSTGFLYWHPELKRANISAVYRCHNGESECESSLIHACAISVSDNDPRIYLPFISCMSDAKPGTAPEDASFGCSNSTSFMAKLRGCALGPEGIRLQHQCAGIASQSSQVPSLTISGQIHNVSEAPTSLEVSKIICDNLFADGRMDRDACQGKAESGLVVPFQSILPAQTPPKSPSTS
jgi:hypothetical protein